MNRPRILPSLFVFSLLCFGTAPALAGSPGAPAGAVTARNNHAAAVLTTPGADSPSTGAGAVSAGGEASSSGNVLKAMDEELKRSLGKLKNAGKVPVYYLAYRLYEGNWDSISASNGAISHEHSGANWRMLSVDLRVGNCHFDNTHFLRGKNQASPTFWAKSSKIDSILPDEGAGLPLEQCLWLTTDEAFKSAQQRYAELTVNNEVMSAEDDKSDDFSFQPVHHYLPVLKDQPLDRTEWTGRVRRLSQLFLKHPIMQSSNVSLTTEPTTRYMVNSEGSQL